MVQGAQRAYGMLSKSRRILWIAGAGVVVLCLIIAGAIAGNSWFQKNRRDQQRYEFNRNLATTMELFHEGALKRFKSGKDHERTHDYDNILDTVRKLRGIVASPDANEGVRARATKLLTEIENDRLYLFKTQLPEFQSRIGEYISFPALKLSANREKNPIRGKVLVVTKRSLHAAGPVIAEELAYLLRDSVATKPEEVGTVIWLEWSAEEIGRYTSDLPQFKKTCKVTVIDKDRQLVIAEVPFDGTDPAFAMYRIDSPPDYARNEATGKVKAYITKLSEGQP